MVTSIASKLAMKTGWRVPVDDLVDAGMVALLQSVRRFDRRRGTQFITFGMARARFAMVDRLRASDHLDRNHRRRVKAGVAQDVKQDPMPIELLQLEASAPAADVTDVKEILDKAEQLFGARDREILELRFKKDLTLLEIARRFRLSESRIAQIVRIRVAELRRSLR